MISTFNGRPTSEMSKAELIDALDVAMGLLNAARRALAFEREATMQRFSSDLARSHTAAFANQLQGLSRQYGTADNLVMRQVPRQGQEVF